MISNALNAPKNIRMIKDIELNCYGFLMSNIRVYHLFTRVYAQTHVNKIGVYKGSQWAVFDPTVVAVYDYNRPPRVQIYSTPQTKSYGESPVVIIILSAISPATMLSGTSKNILWSSGDPSTKHMLWQSFCILMSAYYDGVC